MEIQSRSIETYDSLMTEMNQPDEKCEPPRNQLDRWNTLRALTTDRRYDKIASLREGKVG
jgi:hypothetical protein